MKLNIKKAEEYLQQGRLIVELRQQHAISQIGKYPGYTFEEWLDKMGLTEPTTPDK